MRTALLILVSLLVGDRTSPGAESKPEVVEKYTEADWNLRLERLKGFDEIRMLEAESVREVPKITPEGTLVHQRRVEYDRQVFSLSGLSAGESVIAMLKFQPDLPVLFHGCRGLFTVVFYRKGEEVGSLHFAHGKYWAPLTEDSQHRLNEWLREQGFPVARLLRKEANKAPEPTTTAVTPRAP